MLTQHRHAWQHTRSYSHELTVYTFSYLISVSPSCLLSMRGEDDCIGRRDSPSPQQSNARPCVYARVYVRTYVHIVAKGKLIACTHVLCIAWRNSLPLTTQHTPNTTPVSSQPLCGPLGIVRKAHHQHTYHTTLHDTRTPHTPYTKIQIPRPHPHTHLCHERRVRVSQAH